MERANAAAGMIALVLLVPTALAASDLRAQELLIAGATALDGDASALFLVSEHDGSQWDATASSATLVREYAEYKAALHPANADSYVAYLPSEWQTEETTFGPVSLASSATSENGALLALAQGGAVDARSEGLVQIAAVSSPTLGQDEQADVATDDDRGDIVHTFEGDFLNATFSEGVFTLRGDLTLVMYGPAYTTLSAGKSADWQTGEYTTSETLYYHEGRQERHTLTLHDAILQLRATEPTTILTQFPTLTVDGTLRASRAEGALVLDGEEILAPADGSPLTYTGAAVLALAPAAGAVAASAPDAALASTGAIVARGPSTFTLTLAAIALLALAAVALVLARRRARPDDIERALLAMEERRWNDALPLLARAARHEPDNAHLLIDRALCLEQVGRFSDAAKAFEQALRAAPRHAEAHFYYARTLAKMREKEAARVHLETALERDPRLVEMARTETVLRGL